MRTTIPLTEGWRVQQVDGEVSDPAALAHSMLNPAGGAYPARMPAQVHEILLAQDKIPDPHIGKNAAACTWVGEQDWAYAARFASPPGGGPVFLCLEGLDTLATAWLNGCEIGRFENMYRSYRLRVDARLQPAGEENELLIIFASAPRFIRQAEAQWGPIPGVPAHKFLRKCHSDFSSYLGARPDFIKVGVFAPVFLDLPGRAWFEDAWVRPELLEGRSRARISVALELAGEPAETAWSVIGPDEEPIQSGILAAGQADFAFDLDQPRLWWPATHGEPALYRLLLELREQGTPCDRKEVRFGVREITPILKEAGSGEDRFAFEVNGQRIFLRGANWAPLEGITHVWDAHRAERLLDLAQQANMNALRVWAEGSLPPQSFYDACDRRGILVWQDFMLGYNRHPDRAPGFAANVKQELEETVRRLRGHACLLLWCGGNENYMGWDFEFHTPAGEDWDIFTQRMPEVVKRLDPGRLFQPSSPFGGAPAPNWPLAGDWHDYTTVTFSPEASVPLFASEIGRASPPSITSMRRYLSEEEIWPAGFDPRVRQAGQEGWPPMWSYRATDGAWFKTEPAGGFCDPVTPEDLVRVLGSAHGEYLQRRVERERRGLPDGMPDSPRRCWGNLIWRLNDCWPVIYWSVVDYYLEPKIAYYFLKRAYAPVLACFEQTADRICAWVVNDSPHPMRDELMVRRMNFKGKVLGMLKTEVNLAPGEARRCLDLTPFGPISLYDDYLWAVFGAAENTHLLRGERFLRLPQAQLSVERTQSGLSISSDVFVRQVSLEFPGLTGAVFSDNFFDLPSGNKKFVDVLHSPGGGRLIIRAANAQPVEMRI